MIGSCNCFLHENKSHYVSFYTEFRNMDFLYIKFLSVIIQKNIILLAPFLFIDIALVIQHLIAPLRRQK